MSCEHVLPSDMGYGMDDAASERCTCGCPDGDGMHLENCESYLRSWEAMDLRNIERGLRQIINIMPQSMRDREVLDTLLASIGHFVNSTRTLGEACVSDPLGIIRDRLTRSTP